MHVSNELIFILMIFCHIIDDYRLQGILASMKQKKWWKENYPSSFYKYDYLVALLCHGFSWSFMMTLPILILYYKGCPNYLYYSMLIINMIFHSYIDHMKCNKYLINLVEDQLTHLLQIIITFNILIH